MNMNGAPSIMMNFGETKFDTIHKYAPILKQGEGLGTQSLDFEPRYDNDSSEDDLDFNEIDN
jgi:hypothetical protein